MDDPAEEITSVIKQLCTADSTTQQQTIDTYFTQDAQFIHPFCRTIPGPNSGWMIKKIYAWYKILSPHIDIDIEGVGKPSPFLPSITYLQPPPILRPYPTSQRSTKPT